MWNGSSARIGTSLNGWNVASRAHLTEYMELEYLLHPYISIGNHIYLLHKNCYYRW